MVKKEISIVCDSNNQDSTNYLITVQKNRINICSKKACENEVLTFNLKCCNTYTFVVQKLSSMPSSSCKFNVYVSNNCCDFFRIHFDDSSLQYITLTDRNYPGLPIEKGEIIIWQ